MHSHLFDIYQKPFFGRKNRHGIHAKKLFVQCRRAQIAPIYVWIQFLTSNFAIAELFNGWAILGRNDIVSIEPIPDLLRRDYHPLGGVLRNASSQASLAAI
jgi:hypothetical protein